MKVGLVIGDDTRLTDKDRDLTLAEYKFTMLAAKGDTASEQDSLDYARANLNRMVPLTINSFDSHLRQIDIAIVVGQPEGVDKVDAITKLRMLGTPIHFIRSDG